MRTKSSKPDLLSFASNRTTSSESANPSSTSIATTNAAVPASLSRYALPADLRNAIKQLADTDFDRLLSAVIAEQKRRGKTLAVSRKRQIESPAVPLTQGKLNAVRAAFKAGVRPSQIARQFGISQSDVRKALIGTATKG